MDGPMTSPGAVRSAAEIIVAALNGDEDTAARLLAVVSAAGAEGMVLGQVVDLLCGYSEPGVSVAGLTCRARTDALRATVELLEIDGQSVRWEL